MTEPEIQVCLSLGSNIAPQKYLPLAVDCLRDYLVVTAVSRAWITPAVGGKGPDFLNAALLARTRLLPNDLKLNVLRQVEAQLGRVRSADKFAPRTIDIDIVSYDDEVLEPELWTQPYLALPVAELLPGLEHPKTGEPLELIARRLAVQTGISPCPDELECE